MNDKCAAGTGRFLDVMSKVLEISMSEMGDWYFKSKNTAPVSSTGKTRTDRVNLTVFERIKGGLGFHLFIRYRRGFRSITLQVAMT